MALADAYATLKSGSLWSSTGKCRGYAVANPGEAAQIDAYVQALATGQQAAPPTLATATGRGIVGMLAALTPAPAPTPPPAPGPSSLFGASLPARMPEASGPIVVVATLADLEHALATAAAGTRIQARAGVYGDGDTSQLQVVTHGTAQAPVQLEAFPSEQPVLAKLFKVTTPGLRIRGFKIVRNAYPTDARFGNPAVPGGGNVGLWIAAPDVEVDGCEVTGTTMSGLFVEGDRIQIRDTRIHGCGTSHDDHGIYWAGGGAAGLVANCVLDGNACFGFQIQYDAGGVIVANCTIVRNGLSFAGSGLVQAGTAHNVEYVNTIAAFNGEVGFKSYVAANTIRRCLAYGNPQGATYGPFGSVDLIAADPLLDTTFKPAASSPVVGVGDPAYTPAYDMHGTQRTRPDLGAVAAL